MVANSLTPCAEATWDRRTDEISNIQHLPICRIRNETTTHKALRSHARSFHQRFSSELVLHHTFEQDRLAVRGFPVSSINDSHGQYTMREPRIKRKKRTWSFRESDVQHTSENTTYQPSIRTIQLSIDYYPDSQSPPWA